MRKLLVLFLLLLGMTLVGPVMAQDDVFCGDLAAEDCDLLKLSAQAMADLSSVAADLNVQIDLEGIPGTPNLNINLSGTAAYDVDDAAMEASMAASMDLESIKTILGGFAGEIALTLTLPDDLAMQAGLPSGTIDLELKLVDGVGYINFDTLDALTGGMLAAQGMTGWGGINFVELLDMAVAANPDALGALDMGTSAMTMMDMDALMGLTNYITIARAADVDGAATFVTTVDFAGMVNDTAFQDLVKEQMEATGQAASDADFAQAIAILQVVASQMNITVTQFVDPATGYNLGGEIAVNVDLTALMAASGQEASGESIISVTASLDYSGFNETTVSAPENASIAPAEMLMGLLGGMSGSGF